jgi:hypothetical protein
MEETNRQYPRHRVSWPVRLRITGKLCLVGRAVDASLHGLRVALVSWVPSGVLRLQERCTIELCGKDGAVRTLSAEIRSVSTSGIGLQIGEALPSELMDAAERESAAPTASLP